MNKQLFKKALYRATGCNLQHNGWPCGTCFFSALEGVTNKDWQAVLLYRGDYKKEDLDNLPGNIKESLKKIMEVALHKIN
jgi:hypothetical protein